MQEVDVIRAQLFALQDKEYRVFYSRLMPTLPPETVIERVTGDGQRKMLLAPLWSLDKIAVLGGIDQEMARRDTIQGALF